MSGANPSGANAGDAIVRAACEANWDAHKADCSGFARAVAQALAVPLAGNADQITDTLRGGGHWSKLADGAAAAAAAAAGKFVVAGLRGNEEASPSAHGHVVVVVSGPLEHGKYPHAYWGRLGSVGAKDKGTNWAWNGMDRDRVTYASFT